MALATGAAPARRARSVRIQSFRAATTGAERRLRTASRSAADQPFTSRSMANSSSMRRTASIASGAITATFFCALCRAAPSMSASSKNFLRAWAQHAASMIGAGLRSPRYSLP